VEFTRFCAVLKHKDEARLEPVEGTLDLSGTLTMRGISPVELHTVRFFPGFSFMTPQNRVRLQYFRSIFQRNYHLTSQDLRCYHLTI